MAGLQVFYRGFASEKRSAHSRADLFLSLFSFLWDPDLGVLTASHPSFPSSRTNQPSGVMRFANMIPFVPSETLLRERDVAERPGDVRLRRPERSGDIRTVRTRQGSNIQKKRYPTDVSFFVSLRARDGIRTRDPRLPDGP